MKSIRPTVAFIALLLIVPAALFMAALFLREVQPLMQTGRLVDWFSHHVVVGLYVFLVAMPLAALVVGSGVLWRTWRMNMEFRRSTVEMLSITRAQAPAMIVAGTTLIAGTILAIVALHLITE